MENSLRQHTSDARKYIGGFLLIIFFVALFLTIIPNVDRKINIYVVFTFIVNATFSLIMIVKSSNNKPYSLSIIHWIFFFFFFGFAGLIQYLLDMFPWDLKPTDEEVITANLLIFAWGTVFCLGHFFTKASNRQYKKYMVDIKSYALDIVVLIDILCMIYCIRNTGFENLLSRGTRTISNSDEKSISLLVDRSLAAFATFSVGFCIIKYKMKRTGINFIKALIAVGCLLVICFPAGMARFESAAIYGGLLVLAFRNKITGRKFIYVFVFAFIVIFPFMNVFRTNLVEDVDVVKAFQNVFNDISLSYTEGHYDAYSMLIQTLRYAKAQGFAWGRQLLGSFLFFVPRKLWQNKPLGSGQTIFESLGMQFTNVSEPLPAEGYINFGIVGLLLFGFLLGKAAKIFDELFWNNTGEGNANTYLDIIYPFAMMFLFFIMRGDMLSSVAYFMGYIVISLLMYKCCAKVRR